MKLVIDWEKFLLSSNAFLAEGQAILCKENSLADKATLEKIEEEIKDWTGRCFAFLKESFDTDEFARSFSEARVQKYSFGKQMNDFKQEVKEVFQDLNAKRNILSSGTRMLSVSDAIIKPHKINLKTRASLDTGEILELILDKLYDLYDNYYYSVLAILEGNGVILKRHGEERELIRILHDQDYVNTSNTKQLTAQLTPVGKMYVEEKRKVYTEDYDDIKDQGEINNRVDEIIEKLNTLGYGQEIIFDEIQELKDLYAKLSKKNWSQIVKGKLVDLLLAKLIENDTVKYIYEKLTDHTLRLP